MQIKTLVGYHQLSIAILGYKSCNFDSGRSIIIITIPPTPSLSVIPIFFNFVNHPETTLTQTMTFTRIWEVASVISVQFVVIFTNNDIPVWKNQLHDTNAHIHTFSTIGLVTVSIKNDHHNQRQHRSHWPGKYSLFFRHVQNWRQTQPASGVCA